MELRNLKTFIRAAELGSFSRAAERLNYAQSTVTAQIEALEQELGVVLFTRTGRKIVLSAAGKELLSYAYEMTGLAEKVRTHFSGAGEPEGELRLGILESICASDYMTGIALFLEKYPGVRLHVTVGTTIQLEDMLKRGEVDVVLLLDRPVSDAAVRILFRKPERIVFFGPGTDAYRNREPVPLEELAEENWLLTEKGCNYRKLLEEELSSKGLGIRDRLEIGSTDALIRFVKMGLGISLLPEFDLKTELESGQITEIRVNDCSMQMDIQILVAAERWISPAVRGFCEVVRRALEDNHET